MGVVLAVDTAGPVIGVAAVEDGVLLRTWSARVVRGAERALHPAISEVLSGRRADAIVVSIGPGAFTGLRVGVAAALGLAKAWDCPVLPTSSLAARAAMIFEQPRVLALLDARKGKVYAGLFDTTSGVPVLLSEERDQLPVDAVPPGPGVAVGEGVAVVESLLVAQNWKISDVSSQSPASALAHWGFNRWGSGEGIAAHEVRLRYLRPPDAKRPKLEGLLRSSNEES